MKKFIAIMCMAVLLVSSALAAGSPSDKWTGSTTKTGLKIVVEDGSYTAPDGAQFGADGYEAYPLEIYAVDEATGEKVPVSEPIDVTLKSYAIENGAKVIVAHGKYNDDGEAVDFVKEEVTNIATNEVTVTLNGLSPVVVYVKNVTEENQDSDKTGEPAVMTVVALIAMAALLGMAVTAKKEN